MSALCNQSFCYCSTSCLSLFYSLSTCYIYQGNRQGNKPEPAPFDRQTGRPTNRQTIFPQADPPSFPTHHPPPTTFLPPPSSDSRTTVSGHVFEARRGAAWVGGELVGRFLLLALYQLSAEFFSNLESFYSKNAASTSHRRRSP